MMQLFVSVIGGPSLSKSGKQVAAASSPDVSAYAFGYRHSLMSHIPNFGWTKCIMTNGCVEVFGCDMSTAAAQ